MTMTMIQMTVSTTSNAVATKLDSLVTRPLANGCARYDAAAQDLQATTAGVGTPMAPAKEALFPWWLCLNHHQTLINKPERSPSLSCSSISK
ncbi:hypothetical protein E2562_039298 [Oryza meyeriana var. granulata]|uniref:Uncharacterized protein n=1 Tax=Oryza meyeriana var. granulata TaxID=110450 RepID=A0A6G1DTZ8_9ORYZ|nr:hypothetical protein E2562_039298 [Oryza meyeriana var. granulata]